MNTLIYLWLDPDVMNIGTPKRKEYFNLIIKGDFTQMELSELEEELGSMRVINHIMDFANIYVNRDFGVVSACLTNEPPSITYTDSPEEREKEASLARMTEALDLSLKSDKPLDVTSKNISVTNSGQIQIDVPELGIVESIDAIDIWNFVEKNIQGKINEGQTLTIEDNEGNNIIDIIGGSYLNVGIAPYKFYDEEQNEVANSMGDLYAKAKGGFYIREDGRIDLGDLDRTFYMSINIGAWLKATLKNNALLTDFLKLEMPKQ